MLALTVVHAGLRCVPQTANHTATSARWERKLVDSRWNWNNGLWTTAKVCHRSEFTIHYRQCGWATKS